MAAPGVEQKLAAILAADVAGYTRLMADDQRTTIDTIADYRNRFRNHIEANGGRVVDMAGDSVLAMTTQGLGGVILYHMKTGAVDTIAEDVLTAPVHVQFVDDRWYVSDIVGDRPSIAVLSWNGELEREFDLEDLASNPHQFAVLPDERVIVETANGELVALGGDSVTTFALVDTSADSAAIHSAAATGCDVIRTATPACRPFIQCGTAALAAEPGQNCVALPALACREVDPRTPREPGAR